MAVDTTSQQVIKSIQGDLQQLYIQHQIQQAMDINQLINPPDERVIDADSEIDEELLALHCPVAVGEPESDTEVLEELLIVTLKQVLELLQNIKLSEIQSDDYNAESIRWLKRYEKIIKERYLKGLKQAGIRSYFNTGEARD
jgi:hypothetical protein